MPLRIIGFLVGACLVGFGVGLAVERPDIGVIIGLGAGLVIATASTSISVPGRRAR